MINEIPEEAFANVESVWSCTNYPDGDVVLRDGSTVRVRMMRPGDEGGLLDLFQSLSEESRWWRLFSPAKDSALAAEAHREATLDNAFALVASSGADERIVQGKVSTRVRTATGFSSAGAV